jgi:hypothetical protein
MELVVPRQVLSMPMPEVRRGEYKPVVGFSFRKKKLQWEMQCKRIRRRHEQVQGLVLQAGSEDLEDVLKQRYSIKSKHTSTSSIRRMRDQGQPSAVPKKSLLSLFN